MFDHNDTRALPKEMVHKHAVDEAFVTGVTAYADGWISHARLPDRHSFHNDALGCQSRYHDPLLVLEAFRQGIIAGSHLVYGVPFDCQYVLRYCAFSVLDFRGLAVTDGPADFEFRTAIRRELRSRGKGPVKGLELLGTATRDGIDAMELSGAFGWMTEDDWTQLRTGARWEISSQPVAADPRKVGRSRSEHVVIGEPGEPGGDGSWSAPIVVNLGDPTFFDHPQDHLPGALILEACRQLAVAALGERASTVVGPSRMRCDFHSFAELNPSCIVALTPAEDALSFRAELTQSGLRRASTELTFTEMDSLS